MINLSGSIVAMVTPFNNKGKVDYSTLKKLIDLQINSGTRGIVPCGTTGESPTLSHDEHREVIKATVEFVKGRVPVIAGTGSNSTREAVDLTRYAKKVGANASLSIVPYYNKPSQTGLYNHFKTIATEAGLPMVLYNIPGRCSVALSTSTILKLAKLDMVIGIKEATGSMDQASAIIAESDLSVLSGDDSLTLPLLGLGASGVISVVANIYPEVLAQMISLFEQGDIDEARKIHYQLYPLCKSLFVETNPVPVKRAMKIMRLCSDDVRLPLAPMSKDNDVILRKALQVFKENMIVEV